MKFLHSFLVLFFVGCIYAEHPQDFSSSPSYQVVNQLASEIQNVIKSYPKGTPTQSAVPAFEGMIDKHFDLVQIAQFVMKSYWHSMNESQKQRFLPIFKKRLASLAADTFQEYSGATHKINSVLPSENITKVYGILIQEGKPDVDLVFDVSKDNKIKTITVGGLFILNTISEDYRASLSTGISLDKFIDLLENQEKK